jgi:hypothetical protein
MYLFAVVLQASLTNSSSAYFAKGGPDEQKKDFPRCSNCYCIPGLSGDCPSPPDPPLPPNALPINKELVQRLKLQIPSNHYILNCNPYRDDNCVTHPPQNLTHLGERAVCGIAYDSTNNCFTYDMITYDSQQSALNDGAVITHLGGAYVQDFHARLAPFYYYYERRCYSSFLFG